MSPLVPLPSKTWLTIHFKSQLKPCKQNQPFSQFLTQGTSLVSLYQHYLNVYTCHYPYQSTFNMILVLFPIVQQGHSFIIGFRIRTHFNHVNHERFCLNHFVANKAFVKPFGNHSFSLSHCLSSKHHQDVTTNFFNTLSQTSYGNTFKKIKNNVKTLRLGFPMTDVLNQYQKAHKYENHLQKHVKTLFISR